MSKYVGKFTQEEYQRSLRTMQEVAPYHLMRRNPETGVWKIIGKSVDGRDAANVLLNQAKKTKRPDETDKDFRVLPKNECDKYAEGFQAALRMMGVDKGPRSSRNRRPLMALPEHL